MSFLKDISEAAERTRSLLFLAQSPTAKIHWEEMPDECSKDILALATWAVEILAQKPSDGPRFCVQPIGTEYQGEHHTVYMIRDLTVYPLEGLANDACAKLNELASKEIK